MTDTEEGDLLDRVVEWANQQPDIAALVMTGSRARPEGGDELSDYDLEIFTSNPTALTDSEDWFRGLGNVWVHLPAEAERGCPTRLVVYEGGEKADFSILPIEVLQQAVEKQALGALYERGYTVLLDKTGLASQLPPPTYQPPVHELPTEAAYRELIEEFWFEASHIPKYLERGDLWVVKFRDWTMKELLRTMLEWHALAPGGKGNDVWYIGMRMKEWVQPGVWERLHDAFGRFDVADSWRALLSTVSLFRDLAVATGMKLGFRYPQEVDDAVSGYIGEFETKFGRAAP